MPNTDIAAPSAADPVARLTLGSVDARSAAAPMGVQGIPPGGCFPCMAED